MAKFPKPYFRAQRGSWAVQIDGRQVGLGAGKDAAFKEYHRLMAVGGSAPSAARDVPPLLAVSVLDQYLDWLAKRVEEGPGRSAATAGITATSCRSPGSPGRATASSPPPKSAPFTSTSGRTPTPAGRLVGVVP